MNFIYSLKPVNIFSFTGTVFKDHNQHIYFFTLVPS